MSDIDPKKLKVTELREELKKHGLDTKGKKDQLVKRLENFLAGAAADTSLGEGDASLTQEEDNEELDNSQSSTTAEPAETDNQPTAPADEVKETVEPETEQGTSNNDGCPEETEKEPPSTEQDKPEQMEATQDNPEEKTEEPMEETENAVENEGSDEVPAATDEVPAATDKVPATDEVPAATDGVPAATDEVPAATDDSAKTEAKTDEHSTETKPNGTDKSDKRKRSRSPREHRSSHRSDSRSPTRKRDRHDDSNTMSDQDWIESTAVQLDRYNCDLNVEVTNGGYTAKPQSYHGFGYMWAGLRANYGVNDGKVAFQMKMVHNLRITIGEESVGANHVSRVGWSVDCGNYQLGEYPLSWGYGGTAKFSTNSKFTDYSVKFYKGDTVTCYLDMTGDNVIMYFAKNDMKMEKATEFPKSDLNGQALFPAVATKNQIMELNFGQMEKPWYPLLDEEYKFINDIPVESRMRSVKPPAGKEECEVLLMVGLPGAGKTYWANQRQLEQPDKRWYILGTNNIIDKMKVEGLPRKNNYHGRWDVLFDQANDCLRKMLETATKRNKNYILDQTNVYDTAQRRKMRPFTGFKRKAVVVLPTDKVFRERIDKRTKEEGKEVPETAVLEMKANLHLPTAPVETALNPEANIIAEQEEKERAEQQAKEAAEKRAKEEEERKAKEEEERKAKEEAEKAKEDSDNKESAEQEPDEQAETKEGEPQEGDEKGSADTVETEKQPKADPESEVKEEMETEVAKTEVKVEPTEGSQDKTDENKAQDGDNQPAVDDVKTETSDTKENIKTEETESADTKLEKKEENKKDDTKEDNKKEEEKKEEEQIFDEVWYTELSGDVAKALIARYIKEGQAKFPPGSRRFRREDRRIGKEDHGRGGGYRQDYRRGSHPYHKERSGYDNRNYSNRYHGSGGGGGRYDDRNRSGGGSRYQGGSGGGYRSGGNYGKSYNGGYGQGGGNWNRSQGSWGGGQGSWGSGQNWGSGHGSWNQSYGGSQGNWGGQGYSQGGYNQGYGGGSGGGQSYRSGGYGNQGYWNNHSYGGGSWNQNSYGGGYNRGSGGY